MQLDPSVLDPSLLVDVAVVRARNAVSHFAVGKASMRKFPSKWEVEADLTSADDVAPLHALAVAPISHIPYSSPGIVAASPAVVSGAAVAGDTFGLRLQLSSDDDNIFVVGAPTAGSEPGAVYYFDVGTTPVTKQALPAPSTQGNARNGSGVGSTMSHRCPYFGL
jgi:hypothetical protein